MLLNLGLIRQFANSAASGPILPLIARLDWTTVWSAPGENGNGESLARGKGVKNPGDPKWLNLHTRMAVELGADAIKTDYSGNVGSMRSVVEQCPVPILVLGGSRHASDKKALAVVRDVAAAGQSEFSSDASRLAPWDRMTMT